MCYVKTSLDGRLRLVGLSLLREVPLVHLVTRFFLGVPSSEETYFGGGTYQNSYVYYKLESKVTSNFDVTSKKLGCFEKKIMTNSNF